MTHSTKATNLIARYVTPYSQRERRLCNEKPCPSRLVISPMKDQDVLVGESVEMICRVQALPRPTVIWMRDSLEITASQNAGT